MVNRTQPSCLHSDKDKLSSTARVGSRPTQPIMETRKGHRSTNIKEIYLGCVDNHLDILLCTEVKEIVFWLH